MAVHTLTNSFGIENSNEAEASLSSDLLAQDLGELSLMGAVISQPDSELTLNIDRSIVDSTEKFVASDLNLDLPIKANVVSNSSDLSLFNNLVMIPSEASAPKTYLVTNNNPFGPGSLRQAIKNANANDGADTIEILSDVTLTADILINDDVTIKGNGHTITQTGRDRIFYIGDGDATNDIQVNLDNLNFTGGNPVDTGGAILSYEALTIKNSSFYGNQTTLRGGAIYQENGSLSIAGSRFSENQINDAEDVPTSAGAGVYAKNTVLDVANTRFEANSSAIGGGITAFDGVKATIDGVNFLSNEGGGITAINNNSLEITNSQFKYNYKNTSGGGLNVEANSTATVTNSVFDGNSANYGGGIEVLNNSHLTLTDSTVTGNSASEAGGGIDVYGSSILKVINSTVENNSAPYGGGIEVINSKLTLTGSTITGNSASEAGGGIDVYDNSVVDVTNSTITGNSSNFGGGIASYDGTSDITLTDTVVTGNTINNLEGDGFTIINTEDLNQDFIGDRKDNTIEGNQLDNHIKGRAGDDTLFGGAGNDTLRGNNGNDTLYGGDGNDRLVGNNGDDTFDGGAGFNIFNGGAGSDLFVVGEGTARILDFEIGTDSIGLSEGLSYEDLTLAGNIHTKLFADGELIAIVRDIPKAELSSINFQEV